MSKARRQVRESVEVSADSFEGRYPNIAAWVRGGWIEIGRDYSRSFVRALDEGGVVWEGKPSYGSLDEALKALEAGIAAWMAENC